MAARADDLRPVPPPRRVPPHDLDAEQSLLGAMLLSRDAIVAAIEVVGEEDFYSPAHANVFSAIRALYGRGEPADPVTVADELRRDNVLDAIGGPGILLKLQAAVPATGAAGRYARIVEELSLLRKLIGVAGEISELGYSLPDDVGAALDAAETKIFQVAERRVTDSTGHLRELLGQSLDHLETLFERGDAITGVPTGFTDLDHRLAGLQPSNLIIVGARPGTGKALALDTPIPTPTGWTTMGDVQPGDEVLDDQGQPCVVLQATEVMHDRPCFEVVFDDGSVLVADADHQWTAYDASAWKSARERHYRSVSGYSHDPLRNARLARDQSARIKHPRTVTTAEMLAEGVRCADGRPNWYIKLTEPLDLPARRLPVDPYVLGCWLGDGTTTSSQLTIGDKDRDHFREEFGLAGYPLVARGDLTYATVPVPGKGVWQGYRGPLRVLTRELQAVGLLGGVSKHIPERYMRGAAKDRLALLQGLLDTDGTVCQSGQVELCLANRPLLAQVRELVCSLGHRPSQLRERRIPLPDGRHAVAWRLAWTPPVQVFRMPRKADVLEGRTDRPYGRPMRRAITAIRPVPSVPVRCISVSSASSLYLAGDSMIPTHNTSFALGIAANAALAAQRPVLFFSLEMSKLEITNRLLCGEAKVDSTRMRNGRLLESDWSKISAAMGRLYEAELYIDDNPMVTVMDVRAKARRLKSQLHDIGLVVVDYIQLMTGRNKAESRQVEVSEISRGLKILARELECPVIALSQLSRGLEQRGDKRPMLSDLRESGCMPASTRLLRADTGEDITLGELVLTQETPLVWSVDDHQRLVPARLTKAFPSGRKPVFRLRLASGRWVDASDNHPFLTIDGWTPLGDLEVGERLAVPGRVPSPVRQLAMAGAPGPADTDAPPIAWDQIMAIEARGVEATFDATVEGTHNFIANGIVAHNSLEQDADVVMFLYRDELYDQESPDKGVAEVIVAKHRAGPTGTCKLAFLDSYTKFANMAKL